MVMKDIKINIVGYWADNVKRDIPKCKGIYFVLARKNSDNRLLYIGKAKDEDINARLANHERHDDFIRSCKDGEGIYYAYAEVDKADIDIVENALIYVEEPPLNTELKDRFNYGEVHIETYGYNDILQHKKYSIRCPGEYIEEEVEED